MLAYAAQVILEYSVKDISHTYPAPGVMHTSPATAPDINPPRDQLPTLCPKLAPEKRSINTQVRPPEEAARLVLKNPTKARRLARRAVPALST